MLTVIKKKLVKSIFGFEISQIFLKLSYNFFVSSLFFKVLKKLIFWKNREDLKQFRGVRKMLNQLGFEISQHFLKISHNFFASSLFFKVSNKLIFWKNREDLKKAAIWYLSTTNYYIRTKYTILRFTQLHVYCYLQSTLLGFRNHKIDESFWYWQNSVWRSNEVTEDSTTFTNFLGTISILPMTSIGFWVTLNSSKLLDSFTR